MNDALRQRIEDALAPHVYDGHLVDAELGDVLDAVMAVVDESLHRALHTDRGRCSYCRVIVSEALLYGDPKPSLPSHKMTCRFYVGPVEHRPAGGAQSLTHWSTRCSCGSSYDAGKGGCPNSAETWRGPAVEA